MPILMPWLIHNHQRRARISLSFLDGLEVLGLRSTHGDLSHIDVTVALGNHAEVFLADLLTRGSELGDSTGRRSLRRLTTRVRVNLGVEDEDVDVFAAGQHVVEATETDVVCPTVTTEDPLALLGEEVLVIQQFLFELTTVADADLATSLLGLLGFFQLLSGNFLAVDLLGFLGAEEVYATVDGKDGLFEGGDEFVSSLAVGDRVVVGV